MSDTYTVRIERKGFEQGIKAYDMVEKTVSNGGNSARVFVPKTWAGKTVKVLLLEPLDEEER